MNLILCVRASLIKYEICRNKSNIIITFYGYWRRDAACIVNCSKACKIIKGYLWNPITFKQKIALQAP